MSLSEALRVTLGDNKYSDVNPLDEWFSDGGEFHPGKPYRTTDSGKCCSCL